MSTDIFCWNVRGLNKHSHRSGLSKWIRKNSLFLAAFLRFILSISRKISLCLRFFRGGLLMITMDSLLLVKSGLSGTLLFWLRFYPSLFRWLLLRLLGLLLLSPRCSSPSSMPLMTLLSALFSGLRSFS